MSAPCVSTYLPKAFGWSVQQVAGFALLQRKYQHTFPNLVMKISLKATTGLELSSVQQPSEVSMTEQNYCLPIREEITTITVSI